MYSALRLYTYTFRLVNMSILLNVLYKCLAPRQHLLTKLTEPQLPTYSNLNEKLHVGETLDESLIRTIQDNFLLSFTGGLRSLNIQICKPCHLVDNCVQCIVYIYIYLHNFSTRCTSEFADPISTSDAHTTYCQYNTLCHALLRDVIETSYPIKHCGFVVGFVFLAMYFQLKTTIFNVKT